MRLADRIAKVRKYNRIRRRKARVMTAAAVAMALALTVSAKRLSDRSQTLGEEIGSSFGTAAGLADGSWKGITQGLRSGTEAGRAAGLCAEDTEATVQSRLRQIGNLEVLAAGAVIKNVHSYGDVYAAFYKCKVNIVFTVDLCAAELYYESDRDIVISLPEVEAELYPDARATEKLAEQQKHFYSGDAADGYCAYFHSMAQIRKTTLQEIANYPVLREQARNAAKEQVGMLTAALCEEGADVRIVFKNEGE